MDTTTKLRASIAFGMALVALLLSYLVFRYTISSPDSDSDVVDGAMVSRPTQ